MGNSVICDESVVARMCREVDAQALSFIFVRCRWKRKGQRQGWWQGLFTSGTGAEGLGRQFAGDRHLEGDLL